MVNTQRIGQRAENIACQYLEQQGLALVGRNYRTRRGEIDLIMRTADSLVFVEVRFRRRTDFGSPAETVGVAKQRRLIACAEAFLQRHRLSTAARFDVICIEQYGGDIRIDWIPDAFRV